MVDPADLVPSDYIIVEIDEELLRRLAPVLLTEARGWQPATNAGWSYRVDAARTGDAAAPTRARSTFQAYPGEEEAGRVERRRDEAR